MSDPAVEPTSAEEALRRWRLVLGNHAAPALETPLSGEDVRMDEVLAALYAGEGTQGQRGTPRGAGLGSSAPSVSRWLGDIRQFFPSSVVRVMQQDAMERLGLRQMLLEPELLAQVQPDVSLVSTLISLKSLLPSKTRETARQVVRKVVDDLERKLANPLRQAVAGSLNRSQRNLRPRHNEIDWPRTIRANLRHYQREYGTIIPETRIGFGRRQASLRDIILCVDQSGSMADSVVYSGVLAAVLASLRSVKTSFVVFDTSVVDLSDQLDDPVELLFGVQLGGGTDINGAVGYAQTLIRRPEETIFILISDLYEGGVAKQLLHRVNEIVTGGTQMITLLALSDSGAPQYDHALAAQITALGSPAFACTPDKFPDLIAAAIQKKDIGLWAGGEGINVERAKQ